MNENNLDQEVRLWQEKLFSRSVCRTRKLNRLSALIGSTIDLNCLEISIGDGTISAALRTRGGSWKTAVPSREAADSLSYSINEPITLLEDGKLPFEDNSFDRVVLVDSLKAFADDYDFLHECHRVLKNDGWVYISETRRAPFSMAAILRRTFGLLPSSAGMARNGYKVNELFNNLKDGFDVPETILYANTLLEAHCVMGEYLQRMMTGGPCWLIKKQMRMEDLHKFRRLYAMAGLGWPIASVLALFEFLPGHRILVKSRRRHWRPRRQPKLIDGRSIAEAAINTKIGTAAPF